METIIVTKNAMLVEQEMSTNSLLIYTVYKDGTDFVCRRHMITKGSIEPLLDDRFEFRSPDLDLIRLEMMKWGLISLARSLDDDESIVECWI